jgi:3-isopropylmalate/(R)-2-methylmalate dehydratase large subunit
MARAMTITEKILAAHCGRESVHPGEIVNARLDLIVCHEVTTPPAIRMMSDMGVHKVFDASKIVVTPDHFVPNKDIATAELTKELRRWVREQGIERYHELGEHGICHALVPEKGYILPGMTAICGDSHTTTLGAVGAFASGVGSTDLAAGLATGELWFRVPETIRFNVHGKLPHGVYSKDLILHIISKIGVDGARYCAMEYHGSAIRAMSMESRLTICNMAVEAGGKSGIMEADDTTIEYIRARTEADFQIYRSDADADYIAVHEIDASSLEPVVALPHLPSNGRFIGEVGKVAIDQAYIGSCTNARIEDLREAASIMKGRHVAPGVRAIVVPATSGVWKQALHEGLFEVFSQAGCVISTATCGACLGGHMGVLGKKERCISTTNRNFVGRMGHPEAEVYLASPATVAASAIAGHIADPRDFMERPLRLAHRSDRETTVALPQVGEHHPEQEDYLWGV